jgi:V-type H+-transporting ATPase subunit F
VFVVVFLVCVALALVICTSLSLPPLSPVHHPLFFLETTTKAIENKFRQLTSRDDVAIILINQHVAAKIRPLINEYTKTIPTILEIPNSDSPYDEESDPIMQRVKALLGGGRK